jgi:hypothetical protein
MDMYALLLTPMTMTMTPGAIVSPDMMTEIAIDDTCGPSTPRYMPGTTPQPPMPKTVVRMYHTSTSSPACSRATPQQSPEEVQKDVRTTTGGEREVENPQPRRRQRNGFWRVLETGELEHFYRGTDQEFQYDDRVIVVEQTEFLSDDEDFDNEVSSSRTLGSR